jgi:hypothetical protein
MSVTPTLLQTATVLAQRGFAVFPCQPRGKEPATARGFLDATVDPEQIKAWWGPIPDMNIGIATGAVSGIWVLDVDGDDGEASLRKLEAEHGALPPTIEAITGKGRHVYFRYGTPIKCSAGQVAPGIDVRGDGGYALTPPSIHPSGRSYAWSVDCAREFADAPDWLLNLVSNGHSAKGKPLEHWHKVLANPVRNGERNTTLASVCGKLLHFGVEDVVLLYDIILCVNLARCERPLTEDEVKEIVASVVKTHLKKLRHE